MKEIKAVLQPSVVERVLQGLHDLPGLPAVTLSGTEAVMPSVGTYAEEPRIKLEVIVPDGLVDAVVRVICAKGRTGHPGDGRVFVIPVAVAYRVADGACCDE